MQDNTAKTAEVLLPNGRIVAVGSGKGGVGKSTVEANMGIELGALGYDVLLVDADPLAKLSYLMGVSPKHGLDEVERGRRSPSEVTFDRYGVKVMPGQSELANSDPGAKEAQQLRGYLKNLRADLYLIDLPAGAGSYNLELMRSANDVVLVLNPNSASRSDVVQTINRMTKENLRRSLDEALKTHSLRDVAVAYLNLKRRRGADGKVLYKSVDQILLDTYQHLMLTEGRETAAEEMRRPLERLTDRNKFGNISRKYHRFVQEEVVRAALRRGHSLSEVWAVLFGLGYSRSLLTPIVNRVGNDSDPELDKLNREAFESFYKLSNGHRDLPMYCVTRLGMSPKRMFAWTPDEKAFYQTVPSLLLENWSEETLTEIAKSLGMANGGLKGKLKSYIGQHQAAIKEMRQWVAASTEHADADDFIERRASDISYDRRYRGQNKTSDYFVDCYRFFSEFERPLSRDNAIRTDILETGKRAAVYEEIRRLKESYDNPPIGILVNMAESHEQGERQYGLIEQAVAETPQEVRYLGTIRADKRVDEAFQLGKPVVRYSPAQAEGGLFDSVLAYAKALIDPCLSYATSVFTGTEVKSVFASTESPAVRDIKYVARALADYLPAKAGPRKP